MVPSKAISVPRNQDWNLTTTAQGVVVGSIEHKVAISGHQRGVTGLLPGSLQPDIPHEETPQAANMSIRQYI